MSGSTRVATSISVVSWKLAVSTSLVPKVSTAQRTIAAVVAVASESLAAAISAAPSAVRRRNATGVVATSGAAPGGSRSMLIRLKSDQFTLVSPTISDDPGELQDIADQICQD